MEEHLSSTVILLIVSTLIATLGYLIAIKQQRHLITGWDESKVSSPETFAKLMGYSLFVLAFGIAIVALLVSKRAASENTVTVALFALTAVPLMTAVYCNITFVKRGK